MPCPYRIRLIWICTNTWERTPPVRTGIAALPQHPTARSIRHQCSRSQRGRVRVGASQYALGAYASGAHRHHLLAPTPDSEINPASVFPPPAGAGEGGGESVYPGSARLRCLGIAPFAPTPDNGINPASVFPPPAGYALPTCRAASGGLQALPVAQASSLRGCILSTADRG
jgi:hypothetical protein